MVTLKEFREARDSYARRCDNGSDLWRFSNFDLACIDGAFQYFYGNGDDLSNGDSLNHFMGDAYDRLVHSLRD